MGESLPEKKFQPQKEVEKAILKNTKTELVKAETRTKLNQEKKEITNKSAVQGKNIVSKESAEKQKNTNKKSIWERIGIKNNTQVSASNEKGSNKEVKTVLERKEAYNYDLSDYGVIHIPQSTDGTNNCSGIARKNQQKILAGTPNADFILFGDAKTKIEVFKKLYERSGKRPGESIQVMEVFSNSKDPKTPIQKNITFTWLHDDSNIINPTTGFQIERMLDESRKYVTSNAPCVREMFVDTHHKHRVTIVYGTDMYEEKTKVSTGKKGKSGQLIYKTITTKKLHTGYWAVDTLRGRRKSGGQGNETYGKIPLPVYFNESNKFYMRGDAGRRYKDLYLRSQAPIGFEPQYEKLPLRR